ncbi:MAG: tRNA (adenosine(37)-N6)-dimethylallyltransferase MiaA [Rhodospirillales bacterium]
MTETSSQKPTRPVLIVAGVTASGKSALALDAAEAFDGVIINADSMQVYREIPVISAAPPAEDRARLPHRLYGVLPITDPCSAGRWQEMAATEINAAHAAGKLPVVVGGTGLYIKALMSGLNELPASDPAIRDELTGQLVMQGEESFRAALAAIDPLAEKAIRQGDRQRLIRAMEVYRISGRALSDWRKAPSTPPPVHWRFHVIAVLPPRDEVYAACEARFDQMLAAGALEEARTVHGLDRNLPGMKAVGLPELFDHLDEDVDIQTAAILARQATRRYAKRQFTWLRHQINADLTLETKYSERNRGEIINFIRQTVLTPRD